MSPPYDPFSSLGIQRIYVLIHMYTYICMYIPVWSLFVHKSVLCPKMNYILEPMGSSIGMFFLVCQRPLITLDCSVSTLNQTSKMGGTDFFWLLAAADKRKT